MPYDMPLYRPPSEAKSLILQITLGCSHNKCTFCSMYKTKKYREKTYSEIDEHIHWAKNYYATASRIFLADGNVLAMDTEKLLEIVNRLYDAFPYLKQVNAYAGPKDILAKDDDELRKLQNAGLTMLYLGVESGSAQVLKNVNKGVTPQEMIRAGQKVIKSGIKLSCMIISGLGGQDLWEEHALNSAKVINAIDPHYLAFLTLLVEDGTLLKYQIEKGEFKLLLPERVIDETIMMLKELDLTNCIFRSNHPSNYVTLRGTLNKDKDDLLNTLTQAKNRKSGYRFEEWRVL